MKAKICLLALICGLLDCVSVRADAIYVGAWSKHLAPSNEIDNSTHNLVAVEYKSYMVGYFKNSYGDDTVAIAKRYELFGKGDWKAGVYIGASYGYKGCVQRDKETYKHPDRSVCALVVPEIIYAKYKTQVVVSLIGNAVAIGPRWAF